MAFSIHPQLLADCHRLGRLQRTHVLLHRNASVPWLILVPVTDCTELLDLPGDERSAILEDCEAAATLLRRNFPITKLNFAALGNVVPQLHLHIIGRHPDDVCWPRPVWGNLPDSSMKYDSMMVQRLQSGLSDIAPGFFSEDGADPGRL